MVLRLAIIGLVCVGMGNFGADWLFGADYNRDAEQLLHPKGIDQMQITETTNSVKIDLTLVKPAFERDNGSVICTLPGEDNYAINDNLKLPIISRWVRLPERGSVRLRVTSDQSENISEISGNDANWYASLGDFNVMPLRRNNAIATLSSPMIMRGVRMGLLQIRPVQWDEDKAEWVVHHQVSIDIETLPERGINEVTQINRQPSRDFQKMLEALLLNPPRRDQPDNMAPGAYLVVAGEGINDEVVAEFVNWKQQAGHSVEIVRFEQDISREDLREIIRDHYQIMGFEYLQFMGSRWANQPLTLPMNDDFHDAYYAQLEGDDILPDVAVGVFDCLTVPQLQTAIRRAVSYQGDPYVEGVDWFTRAAVCVGACSVPDDLSPSYTGKWVHETLLRSGFNEVESSYFADNGVDDPTPLVTNLYNNRTNFILVRAHQHSFNPDAVFQTGVFPFHFLVSSSTISPPNGGAFNGAFRMGTPDALRGPSAGFGHYGSPRTNVANALAGGLIQALFLLDIESYGWARNYTVADLARVMNDGLEIMPRYYASWLYYGDTGQWLWRGVPRQIRMERLDEFDINTVYHRVRVMGTDNRPVPNAIVSLHQVNGFQTLAITNELGWAELYWRPDQLREGEAAITVTGKNLLPIRENIRIAAELPWVITPTAVWISDQEGGDNDEIANPGESLVLSVNFINLGRQRINSDPLRISIESLSPWAEANGEVVWEDAVEPNGRIRLEDAFNVEIFPGCPDGQHIPLRVTFTWDRTFTQSAFDIEIRSSKLEYLDAEAQLDVGEESPILVTIINNGRKNAPQTRAFLDALSPFVVTTQRESAFPAIERGQAAGLDGNDFLVQINPSVISGQIADFRLILIGDPGIVDTVYFSLPIGEAGQNDALGPDKYGYFALDDTDDNNDWSNAPEYEWIEIIPWRQDPDFQGEALPINMGEEDDVSILVQMPFPFRYYGQEFQHITVCSNGWIAVGDQRRLLNQQNWQLPGFNGAYGMIAVFWDRLWYDFRSDGLYAFYDQQGGRYIIEWAAGVYNNNDRGFNVFQLIIFDPQRHPTRTGDCRLLFQYNTVSNIQEQWEANAHASVGISSPDGKDGLTYTYWNDYPPPCAPLMDRRAILWTTLLWDEPGTLQGRVTRELDGVGVPNAELFVSHCGNIRTDAEGNYRLENVPPGRFEIEASAPNYGEVIVRDLVMDPGGELRQDIVLPHGWLTVVHDSVFVELNYGDYEEIVIYLSSLTDTPVKLVPQVDGPAGMITSVGGDPISSDTITIDGNSQIEYRFEVHGVHEDLTIRDLIYELVGKLIFITNTPQQTVEVRIRGEVYAFVKDENEPPQDFALYPPHPNPFNAMLRVDFDLPRNTDVEIHLTDLQGRVIKSLSWTDLTAGKHSITIDDKSFPAGIYFVHMHSKTFKSLQRVVLLK